MALRLSHLLHISLKPKRTRQGVPPQHGSALPTLLHARLMQVSVNTCVDLCAGQGGSW